MKKTMLKEIQKRLPDDIIIEDETNFELTGDEFVSVLSWIKFFNGHYRVYGKNENPSVVFPIISKRLRLDFGLYRFPSDSNGQFNIYLSPNGKLLDGSMKKRISVKELINSWDL